MPFRITLGQCNAERWVKSARTECVDHLLVFNEAYLCRAIADDPWDGPAFVASPMRSRCYNPPIIRLRICGSVGRGCGSTGSTGRRSMKPDSNLTIINVIVCWFVLVIFNRSASHDAKSRDSAMNCVGTPKLV